MGNIIRAEVSEKNPYWIEKHRHYELKHFCLQYPIWKKAYSSLNGMLSRREALNAFGKARHVSNPTERIAMLSKAMENDLLVKNPAKHLVTRICNEPKKERRVLTIKETELFIEYAKNCRYYNLFIVALETGMRIGELGGLFWSDVDFKKRAISINRTMCYVQGKNGYYFETHSPKTVSGKRLIPMTNKCAEALTRQKLIQSSCKNTEFSDLVFSTMRNRPLQEMSIITSINTILTNMSKDGIHIQKFRPHAFRHTFATRAIENGVNPKTLQKLLGHSTLQMTMDLYCHVTDDTLFNEMKKMEI